MCGISGWIDYSENLVDNELLIKKMTRTLLHRGPDSEGYFVSKHALLGHKRLAIIDLVTGDQPMTRGNFTIVYNGEVYNANEIREQLIKCGYTFHTTSDTEVILIAYCEWKERCMEYLNGIFGFAIWDAEEQSLFLCRDRLGVKPLFYYEYEGGILFSSEIKGILAHPFVKPQVDIEGLAALFSLGPSRIVGNAIFKGIKEVKPAYAMVVHKEGKKSWQYWDIVSKHHEHSEEETIETVRELVTKAIERQLISDVPISTMLSGGLDSSIITAVAAEQLAKENKTLSTYSVAYEENDQHFQQNSFQTSQDEFWIGKMQQAFQTNHKQVTITQQDLVESLQHAMILKDMPSMADIDSSLYLFCKEMKNEHTVALSGECADEVFGGYPWFYGEKTESLFPWLRSTKEREQLFKTEWQKRLQLPQFMQNTYDQAIKDMPHFIGNKEEQERQQLFYLNNLFFMQTLLERNDRMTMGASMEVRVPFADHTIIEYVWNIPWEMKNSGGKEKGILREAFSSLLPKEVVERKKNPYPKTYHPKYTELVHQRLQQILQQKDSVLYELFEHDQLKRLLATNGQSFQIPWFGQLMAGPQLIAYLIQLHDWVEHYRIDIIST
ncbi:asparagine synthase (glutamine-hydrolyzing) [Solibacillus merdavium]|uniref:asparagine synthase (glutamine-hydrolyzing) n=1 Tax=Solibacillus merdavium TaxID=2762218 RepID=A0ABR8XSQ5_9BACL|nr:asparagine synthase (glutamine-hydrolyzing) [Solibacillus merdavium]MBD8034973.1 asparagine synthase (glutamine-hydrolyzing) [Solibacillus merdavium]